MQRFESNPTCEQYLDERDQDVARRLKDNHQSAISPDMVRTELIRKFHKQLEKEEPREEIDPWSGFGCSKLPIPRW